MRHWILLCILILFILVLAAVTAVERDSFNFPRFFVVVGIGAIGVTALLPYQSSASKRRIRQGFEDNPYLKFENAFSGRTSALILPKDQTPPEVIERPRVKASALRSPANL